jgi:hypothetical protein
MQNLPDLRGGNFPPGVSAKKPAAKLRRAFLLFGEAQGCQ